MDSHRNAGADDPIFSQFDVRVNKNGKEQYLCHLSPCREKNFTFDDHHSWEIHRITLHRLLREALPGRRVVRKWIQAGKPVPYPWPFPRAAAAAHGPVDTKPPKPAIAAVARAAVDGPVDTTPRKPATAAGTRAAADGPVDNKPRKAAGARAAADGPVDTPPRKAAGARAAADGPVDTPPRKPATAAGARAATPAATSSRAGSSNPRTPAASETEEQLQPASADSNIFFQFDVRDSAVAGKPQQFFCLLPPCFEKNHFLAKRWNLAKHRKDVHKVPSEEKFPSLTTIGNWIALGKPRPFEDPDVHACALARTTSGDDPATASRPGSEASKKVKPQAPASTATKPTPADQNKDLIMHFSRLTVKRG